MKTNEYAKIVFLGLVASFALGCAGRPAAGVHDDFVRTVAELSEPNGFFDTDNLISNERSYLHAVSVLESAGVQGGAYIGVGPDQNFSYIAAIRPELALIIDIRRDNMLLQLLYKALFELAPTRVGYLALLHGRPLPEDATAWRDRDIEQIVGYVEATEATRSSIQIARRSVDSAIARYGVPLDESDRETIDRFHREFIRSGPTLRFTSHFRGPRFYYPTYRDLILETDLSGRRVSYLASAESFEFMRRFQAEDRLIPIVGDLAGDHAVRAIGEHLRANGLAVSAFYTSNVEFYMFRGGDFSSFIGNLESLPFDDESVVIRSIFGTRMGPHPQTVPGYYSTQVVQPIGRLTEGFRSGAYRSYWDAVTRDLLN